MGKEDYIDKISAMAMQGLITGRPHWCNEDIAAHAHRIAECMWNEREKCREKREAKKDK